jgi:cobalt-zinc-cadmium efflux system membrane fusion protein
MIRSRLVQAAACLLFLAGCSHARAGVPPSDPSVAGESITFPHGAPQLSSLALEQVTVQPPANERLFARLAWDDDVTARVFTPFAGRVRRLLVDVGTRVRKGEPLAELESPDFGQAQADARTAMSALRLADSDCQRLQDLFDHGAAARKDLEAAEAERARAEAERARAQARLSSAGAGVDSVNGIFLLRSPISGTVVERNLTAGQEVRPDQMLANQPSLCLPLFVVSEPSRLWIDVDAAETDLNLLRAGMPIHFTTAAYPGRTFEGRIDVVSDAIDPDTHMMRARGTVNNADRLLKSEMLVTAEVPRRSPAAASVPSQAVFLKGDRHYVFVETRPGTFTRREVWVSEEQDSRILVSRGVQAGERVVSEGSILLEQLLEGA